jgi:GNAT superfamily N-acetyltransferase
MAPDDAEAVSVLLGELGYAVVPAEVRRRASVLEPGRHGLFVAEADAGTLRGWVHVGARETLLAPPQAEILGLVVAAGGRGRGTGRSLVDRALRWAREHGFATVRVSSNTARIESHPFYRRLGFVCGKHSAIYHRSSEALAPASRELAVDDAPLSCDNAKA